MGLDNRLPVERFLPDVLLQAGPPREWLRRRGGPIWSRASWSCTHAFAAPGPLADSLLGRCAVRARVIKTWGWPGATRAQVKVNDQERPTSTATVAGDAAGRFHPVRRGLCQRETGPFFSSLQDGLGSRWTGSMCWVRPA